ncbi:glycerophosphodiester phosphodiesterase family protein [Scatolibacter rhodanostii]|uniref:glycerophosphodiester phosphodiesterase family protein n=1 Tax=Scatolibacter rhodanostii TaxID=2014781 RepID=UPI000C074DD9|nr:glycerophosphodiester phosphodiesterase family protein [Scatolibacter rhodanostii]
MYLPVVLIAAICVIIAFWLWAIAPNVEHRGFLQKLAKFDYAHRGLHNNKNGIPENSLKAFRLAAESGFGIELDVQLTKDNQVVVHHDADLRKSGKVNKKISELTFAELQAFSLFNTEEQIPLFSETLKAVGSRVPIIVEIKAYNNPEIICPLVAKILQDYTGLYCIESFDPRIVRWFRQNRPNVVRGQLMGKLIPSNELSAFGAFAGMNMLTNFLTRPDFEAYDFIFRNNISLRLAKTLLGMQEVSWTLRNPEDYAIAKNDGAICIFEGFVPNQPQTDGKKSIFEEARTAAAALITVKN